MVDQKLERLSTDNKPERRPDTTLDHNRHAEWLQCSGAILHWQMQRTCLAYFGNMHIGKFAAPDTRVLRSGEAQHMSQILMQFDTIKWGEHIWSNEKARASRDLTSENLAGPVTFQI